MKSARARLCFVLWLLAPSLAGWAAVGQTTSPLLASNYSAAQNRVLAEAGGKTVRELDLLMNLMIQEDKHSWILDSYLREEYPEPKQVLRDELRGLVRECVYQMILLDRVATATPIVSDFDQLLLNSMMIPVLEFVWIDRVIRPEIEITSGDERHYYRSHPEIFLEPATAHVRHIYREIKETFTPEEISEEEEMMDLLRDRVLEAPSEFARLAGLYSQAPSARNGGEIPPFEEGQHFEAFEEAAFRLQEPGDISQIVYQEDGLYLIQLIGLTARDVIPFEEARQDAGELAAINQCKARYQFTLKDMREKGRTQSRARFWDDLLDTSWLFKVGSLTVSKGDLWRLYPEIISEAGARRGGPMNYRAQRMIDAELIRRDLKKRGFDGDPRIELGRQWVKSVYVSRLAEKQYVDDHLRVVELEQTERENLGLILQGIVQNKGPRKRLFRVWGEVEDPQLYDATTLANLLEHMPQVLQSRIDAAIRGSPEAEETDREAMAPLAVRSIKDKSSPHYDFHWSDMGYVNFEDMPLLGQLLKSVAVGRFSPVERTEDGVVAYFVASEKRFSPEEREMLGSRFRRRYVEDEQESLVDVFRSAITQTLPFTYYF